MSPWCHMYPVSLCYSFFLIHVCFPLTGQCMVEFLRAGPAPYSHPVGSLTYNHSFNHHHMLTPPKYKLPSSGLSLVSDLCIQLSVSHLYLDISKPPLIQHIQRQMLVVICKPGFFSRCSPETMMLLSIKLHTQNVRVPPWKPFSSS